MRLTTDAMSLGLIASALLFEARLISKTCLSFPEVSGIVLSDEVRTQAPGLHMPLPARLAIRRPVTALHRGDFLIIERTRARSRDQAILLFSRLVDRGSI